MTWDELNAIIQRHGGALSDPVIIDPVIDNPDPIDRKLNPKIDNPNPTYRYNLKDGKYFTAKASGPGAQTGQPGEGSATTFQVVDPGSAVQPLTPSDRLPSAATDLVKLDAHGNVIAPGDTTTPAAKLRDPSTGVVTDLPDPKTQAEGKTQEFGDNLLLIKPDGSYTIIASKDPKATQQNKQIIDGPDGKYEYDPNKPEGQRTTLVLKKPADQTKPTTEVRNGKTFQWDPEGKTWSEAPGLPTEKKPATASVNTTAKFIVYYDEQGNEVSRSKNPNYVEPTPTQLTADTVSPNIPLLKPDGTVQWVKNENRVPASQAMQDLLAQVGVKVNKGDLSMGDAKDMLSGTVNVMNAQTAQANAQTAQAQAGTQAATGALSALGQGAQTGAGILQNRVSNAQQMLQGILGVAGQGQRSGNMGGGLMSAPAGLGEALIGGIQGWTTELGGGQSVYDTAARLVQQADPTNSPQAQAAYGVLTQMLEKYKQTTGQDHPAVAATNALSSSVAANGMSAPGGGPPGVPAAPAAAPGLTPEQQIARRLASFQTEAATNQAGGFGGATPFRGVNPSGMAAVMPNVPPQPVTPDAFVAPQQGMASLFVPGNPFVAPPMVRPTVVA